MNVVDSSAWLEYFSDGPNASVFAKPIESTRSLLVPTLSLFEVFKRVSQQRSEDDALKAVAVMEQGSVLDLDRATAIEAALSFALAPDGDGGQRKAGNRAATSRNALDAGFGLRRSAGSEVLCQALEFLRSIAIDPKPPDTINRSGFGRFANNDRMHRMFVKARHWRAGPPVATVRAVSSICR